MDAFILASRDRGSWRQRQATQNRADRPGGPNEGTLTVRWTPFGGTS